MRLRDKKYNQILFYETIYKIQLVYLNPGLFKLSASSNKPFHLRFFNRYPSKALSLYFSRFYKNLPKVHFPIPITNYKV